jgi:hypothetical protein
MSAREIIADIISVDTKNCLSDFDVSAETIASDVEFYEAMRASADAILAALPDMIAPLVWERLGSCRVSKVSEGQYAVEKCGDRWAYWLPENDEEDEPFGFEDTEWDAKGSCDAHHRAAIMAAFNGEAKP